MDVCKICLCSNANERVVQRCDCKSGLIHDRCLIEWIKYKQNIRCEICKKEYIGTQLTFKFKDDMKVCQKMVPLMSSWYVIFLTLGYYFATNKTYQNQKVEEINSLKYLSIFYFLNIINSNDFKRNLMEIENVSFCI